MRCLASILVRTKNEGKYLAQTIEAIRAQSFQSHEIMVVDSGSTDGTLNLVASFEDVTLLRIAPEEFTFGRALNVGAERARGEYLVTLSAHALPRGEHWLFNLVRPFDDPLVAGVYGRQLPRPDAYPPVKVDYLCHYNSEARVLTAVEEAFFSNANAAIRRQLWNDLPFDEDLPACEDQDWARKALTRGYKIVYEPQAAVYHSHNEFLWAVYRRYRREERGWRQILPDRQVDFRDFYQVWRAKTASDVKFILREKESKVWLLLSPVYRLFWALGQWRP